jgi:hypothetical protein
MTDILFAIFISANIFPFLVIILSFVGYAVYCLYRQIKIEIQEDKIKTKGKI